MGRGPRAETRRAVFDRGFLVSIGFILTPAFSANCVRSSVNSALFVKGAMPNVVHQKPNLGPFLTSLFPMPLLIALAFGEDYIWTLFSLKEPAMRYSSQVKPISYLKANAAEVLLNLAKERQPMVITQNGEAKAVIQDVASFEETQETLALLKVLALGNQEIEAGKVKPVADVAARLRAKVGK